MANLGTIKSLILSNGDTVTFKIPLYTGTGTIGQSGSKTVDYIPSLWTFDIGYTPVAGDMIAIKVPVAGVSSGVWISIDNGTTYYPIATVDKTMLTTQYPINSMVLLLYEPNATTTTYGTTKDGAPANSSAADLVSNRWTVVNGYDSGTTYSAMTSANMIAGTETTVRGMRADYLKTGLQGIITVANGDVQLYGAHLTGQVPAVTASDNGKMLQVSNGEWEAIETAIIGDINSVPIASFSDAIPIDALDVTIGIEPVQDLHGYDNPWPAGGGKNLCPPIGFTHTGIATDEGQISTYATRLWSPMIPVVAGSTYTAKIDGKSSNNEPLTFNRWIAYDSSQTFVQRISLGSTSLSTVTQTIPNGIAYIVMDIRTNALTTEINESDINTIQLELGSSATSYSPYSNICPISGWTGANVVVSPTTSAQDGTTYPISWQSEAGTVYGGTLDVTTGLLTVTMAEVDLGTLNWKVEVRGYNTAYSVGGALPALYDSASPRWLCSAYKSVAYSSASSLSDMYVWIDSTYRVRVKDTSKNELTDATFKAAMSGVQLVYELATPQTYQLTPTDVTLLLGDNNVWADTGDIFIKYRRQDVLGINENIATMEEVKEYFGVI